VRTRARASCTRVQPVRGYGTIHANGANAPEATNVPSSELPTRPGFGDLPG